MLMLLSKYVTVNEKGQLIVDGKDKKTGESFRIIATGLLDEASTIKFFGQIIRNKF